MLRKVSQLSAKDILLSLASAVLLIFSFPNFSIWPLAWFGFVPIFFALKDKTRKQAFLLFFLTGVIFWSGTVYWLIHVTLPGTIILILYLALYFAVFGLIIRPFTKKSTPFGLIFIPAVWVLLEFIRGWLFTGFPWALLGYSQHLNLFVIQIADITGAWGVSFLVMLSNVAIVEIVWSGANGLWPRLKKTVFLFIAVLILSLCYGYYSLSKYPESEARDSIRISVIQGNIPQELKWDKKYASFILNKYFLLTEFAVEDSPDLIVWPEAAVPGILGEDDRIFQEMYTRVGNLKVPLITGAVIQDNGLYFGSALLINGSGEIAGRYDKLHLVPFGEYIPLKRTLPFLQAVVPIGDIERGREYTIFSLPATGLRPRPVNFAVLDCFEDVFPELAREFTKRGAKFLVNITNDAWYMETSAPYQHMQASVFRAIENRLPLARSANTGVSCFIAPSGKITSSVRNKTGQEIFIDGYKTEELEISRRSHSFYTRYGDFFVAACFLIAFCGIIVKFKKRIKTKK